jgi:hypothetical protein
MGFVITFAFCGGYGVCRMMLATMDKGILDGFTVGSRNAIGMVVSDFGIIDFFFKKILI